MGKLKSGFAPLLERFIAYRKASGSWNEPCYGLNIRLFDNYCADNYGPGISLTQEMVYDWCTKRDTESNSSNDARTRVVRAFIEYLKDRGLTDVLPARDMPQICPVCARDIVVPGTPAGENGICTTCHAQGQI
jgi:hypothetical protein